MRKASEKLTPRQIFARNVRRARRFQEMSQEALGFAAGLDRSNVSAIEQGKRNVSIDLMGRLAEALNVPLRDLVDPEALSLPRFEGG